MNRPDYSTETEQRIEAALARAQASTRRAHLLGHNDRHGYTVYQVFSTHSRPTPYTLRVYSHPVHTAFVYYAGQGWIQCECPAALACVPCVHGGIVARRLRREAQRRGEKAQEVIAPAPKPARKLTLLDLFEDVA